MTPLDCRIDLCRSGLARRVPRCFHEKVATGRAALSCLAVDSLQQFVEDRDDDFRCVRHGFCIAGAGPRVRAWVSNKIAPNWKAQPCPEALFIC